MSWPNAGALQLQLLYDLLGLGRPFARPMIGTSFSFITSSNAVTCIALISANSFDSILDCLELLFAVGANVGIKSSERFARHSLNAAHDLACLDVRFERLIVRARGCAGFRPRFTRAIVDGFAVVAAAFLLVAVGEASVEASRTALAAFKC